MWAALRSNSPHDIRKPCQRDRRMVGSRQLGALASRRGRSREYEVKNPYGPEGSQPQDVGDRHGAFETNAQVLYRGEQNEHAGHRSMLREIALSSDETQQRADEQHACHESRPTEVPIQLAES